MFLGVIPTILSGKAESKSSITVIPMLAAIANTIVPLGNNLLTFKPFSFKSVYNI
ncbi:hypothetical protein Rh054_04760 [Rickettsia conorii subsp. heilongjiangensis 054]|nr:hypothetical protein Rh054_04760 [Rickettsia conorii subsp. heilongjiangensis 054]